MLIKSARLAIPAAPWAIRSFQRTDVQELVRCANNPNISMHMRDSFPYPYTERDAREWIASAVEPSPLLNFAIAENHRLIGGIGLIPQEDVFRHSAEIGYWVAEPYWGRGVATAAVRALTRHAFCELEFARLFAGVFETNPASERVLLKAGYLFEGRFRKAILKRGKLLDQLVYSILAEETV